VGPTQAPVELIQVAVPTGITARAWDWPFILCSANIKNEWSYTSTILICLHSMFGDNCTLLRCRNFWHFWCGIVL